MSCGRTGMPMSAPTLAAKRANLESLIALARLLERIERGGAPVAPDQYQVLVERLGHALQAELPDGSLQAVLSAHAAAAELYENQQYAHAGLCRSPLDQAVVAERQARDLIARVAATPAR